MSARWWSLGVWALAAASALFWGLRLFVTAPAAPPHTQQAAPAVAAHGDLTRLLGALAVAPAPDAAPEPTADARFQLLGVLSPRSSQAAREGVALIAVDGKPAKAFRVGAVVDGQTVLHSVEARGATLGPRGGAAVVALNIAPPPPAATGMLPPGVPGMPPAAQVQRTLPPSQMGMPPAQAPGQRRAVPAVQPPPDGEQQPNSAPETTLTR